jgi:hypothetical protein
VDRVKYYNQVVDYADAHERNHEIEEGVHIPLHKPL